MVLLIKTFICWQNSILPVSLNGSINCVTAQGGSIDTVEHETRRSNHNHDNSELSQQSQHESIHRLLKRVVHAYISWPRS